MRYTLIILLLFAIRGYSQSFNIDSLKLEAEKQDNKPVKQFNIYYLLSTLVWEDDIIQSIHYVKKANETAWKAGLKQELTKSYLLWTTINLDAGHIEDAHETAIQGLQMTLQGKNYEYQYYAYRNMANVYRRQARYDSALYYYMGLLKVCEEHLNDTFVSNAYTGLGAYYATMGELDKAESYHLQALEIRERQKDTIAMANSYNNLGIINRDRGDYKKALTWYFKTRDIYYATQDSSDISFIYNDIGASYSKSGMLDSGEYYLKKSIGIRERMKEYIELAYTYNYLGENYERQGDLKNAEIYIKKALALAIEIKNNKQNYEAFESLSDFYARNKMYDSAYKYLQHYRFFRDSIRSMDNEKMIAELNTRYETEKKEKKIQEQEFALTKKNYWLGGSAVLLLSVTLLGYSGYRRYKLKKQAELQAAVLKQQEMATKAIIEAEENERKRIAGDLHDGVGQMMSAAKINLSAVMNDIAFADDSKRMRFENALKLVDDSCTEVRNVSHNIMPNSLLRNSLAAAVRDFINKIDNSVLKINLHAEGLNEKIDENIEIMLYRVVQECVNNVIKHSGADTLDIALANEENEISVTIEDNGKGFDTSDKSKYDGIGLKNITTRVDYLKGTVEWDSAPGRGTVVSIHIPL
jgi:two-component system NarL family sensor kinase